jgi:hypothetical protein
MWRTSAGQITFPAPSVNKASKNLLSTAIYWFKTPGPRFTDDWNSGEHCTACRQAKRPERREVRFFRRKKVPAFFRLQIPSKWSLWSYLSALLEITKSQIRLRSSTGNEDYHILRVSQLYTAEPVCKSISRWKELPFCPSTSSWRCMAWKGTVRYLAGRYIHLCPQ